MTEDTAQWRDRALCILEEAIDAEEAAWKDATAAGNPNGYKLDNIRASLDRRSRLLRSMEARPLSWWEAARPRVTSWNSLYEEAEAE